MAYSSLRSNRGKFSKPFLIVVIATILAGIFLAWLVLFSKKADAPAPEQITVTESKEQPEAKPPVIKLQPVIDKWLAKQSAEYSIVVYDAASKKIIGQAKPDKVYFAASLYKIYVAYLALLDIQNGKMDPSELISGTNSRKTCIDRMIRESFSPCGEAMMADMGQTVLNNRVKAMGMNGTFFNGIRTSAQDSALILRYINEKRDLNDKNTAFLKNAMRIQDQKFRNGLAKGAPKATWETKVGWNENINYHDIGIMTMPDGRQFMVAILSQGNGSAAPIADFARTIYAALKL